MTICSIHSIVWCFIACSIVLESYVNGDVTIDDLVARVESLEALVNLDVEQKGVLDKIPSDPGNVEHGILDDPDRFVVARPMTTWHQSNDFIVAVNGLPQVTAVHVHQDMARNSPLHFLVGGFNGRLNVHSMSGSLILDYETTGASPITAIAEAKYRTNATHVITGHADGCVRWHILEHSVYGHPFPRPSIEQIHNKSYCPTQESTDPYQSIKLLHVGRAHHKQKRLAVVAVTESNNLLLFKPSGQTPVIIPSQNRVHHIHVENQQIRLLTDYGISQMSMNYPNATVRPMTCKGLNETQIIAAGPDPDRKSTAYGLSIDGELITLSLPGDKRVVSCRVRSKRPLKGAGSSAAVTVMHDGVLVVNRNQLVFTDSSLRGSAGQSVLIKDTMVLLRRILGLPMREKLSTVPVVFSNSGGYVIIQVTDSTVVVYRRLPPPAVSSALSIDWLRWSRPAMILAALIFGMFHFSRRRSSRMYDAAAMNKMRNELLQNHARRRSLNTPSR